MRILEAEKEEEEYMIFLKNHDRCDFQQSLEWAKLKNKWIREVILAEDEQKNIIITININYFYLRRRRKIYLLFR